MRALGYFAILLSLCNHGLALGQDSSVAAASTTEWGRLHRCRPGPWGELEYYFVPLEAPGHIVDLIPAPSERPIWHFPGRTIEEIDAILTAAAISLEDRKRIFAESRVDRLPPPYRLFPPIELLENLSPISRKILHRELGQHRENRFHYHPVIIESGDVRDWFENSSLSSDTIERIEKLSYPLGKALALSDIPVLLGRITTDREERALLKSLTRTRSMILRLTISADSDHGALKSYWSMGNKGKDVLSYFESISMTPKVEKIDTIHLLPPTPRRLLNTFPSQSLGIEGQFPGNHWTSLNFYRFQPLSEFDDEEVANFHIDRYFAPAAPPFQFGDLVTISDPVTRDVKHTCTFIADDIVYTKNGRSILRPFMLMRIDDMLSRFPGSGDPVIKVFRPK